MHSAKARTLRIEQRLVRNFNAYLSTLTNAELVEYAREALADVASKDLARHLRHVGLSEEEAARFLSRVYEGEEVTR